MDSNNEAINLKTIAIIAKKCPNISRVVIDFDADPVLCNEIAETVVDNCDHITDISFEHFMDIDDTALTKLFGKYGPNLKCIWMTNQTALFDSILFFGQYSRFCPNLIEFRASNLFFKFAEFIIATKALTQLPNLKRIEYIQFTEEDRLLFKGFIWGHLNLESIKVLATSLESQLSLNYLMFCLSRLRKLKTLGLFIRPLIPDDKNHSLDSLKVVGACCPVKQLVLDFTSDPETIEISVKTLDSIINIIKFFPNLKRLAIRGLFPQNSVYKLKSESFKTLKKLTHLTFRFVGLSADDNFFVNIDRHLPSLQYLYISLEKVTPYVIDSLKKLYDLRQTVFVVPRIKELNENDN